MLRENYDPRYQSMVMTVSASSIDEISAARAKFARAMTPPTIGQIEGWLAELSVITARRQDDDDTESLRFSAYVSRLSDCPADIARHALLGRRWKFFPAWADLADACDEALCQRRRMMRALDQAEHEMREKQLRARALPTEQTHTLTPDEVAARKTETDRMISELLGSLKAKSAQQDADAAARAEAASANYEKFRHQVSGAAQ